jgi:hypothetical protein
MPPLPDGGATWLHTVASRLRPWQRSALAGAALIVALGAVAVVAFLGLGIARSDLRYILLAAILLFVLASSGAAGGIVYYATSGLRGRSTIGFYASAILTVYGYLFSVLGLIVLSFLL